MRESKCQKHCNTCRYSYMEPERTGIRTRLRQKCSSPDYNTTKYIHDNIMEDWDQGRCRFWSPKY